MFTENEYNCSLQDFLANLSCEGYNHMIKNIWYTGKSLSNKSMRLLWLFVFALNDYTYGDENNYITEQQAMNIFAKANTLK